MVNTNIKFGTSGWRARIAEDFTYSNLKRVSHAVSAHILRNKEYGFKGEEYSLHLKQQGLQKPKTPVVVIGYDTRYLSDVYARIVAESLLADNIAVIFSNIEAPTPVVAWEVLKNNSIGGVMITASHNPPEDNGFKWTPFWGGPAIPEITSDIENRISGILNADIARTLSFHQGRAAKLVRETDFHKRYFAQISSIIDKKIMIKGKLKVAVDPVYGASKTYLAPLLENFGAKVARLREERDVMFGGHSPDTDKENLSALIETVKKNKLHLGLATDGDGDRFGIVDSDGTWISPNTVLALILDHLVTNKNMRGKVAKSVMTSNFVDAVAKYHGLEIRETPVGFKYIGNFLRTGQFVLGGEESGGLSIMGHVPEKDGILACLLIAELVAIKKKSLRKIIGELNKKVGVFLDERVNLAVKDQLEIKKMTERLKTNPPLSIAGNAVWRINEMDGFKFIFKDGAWLGLRPSGTEPVVRIYAESNSQQKLQKLIDAGKKIATGKI